MSPRAAASLLEARRAGPSKHLAHSAGGCCFTSRSGTRDPGGVRVEVPGLWTAGAMLWSAALGATAFRPSTTPSGANAHVREAVAKQKHGER
jgi:hypothetical protein